MASPKTAFIFNFKFIINKREKPFSKSNMTTAKIDVAYVKLNKTSTKLNKTTAKVDIAYAKLNKAYAKIDMTTAKKE